MKEPINTFEINRIAGIVGQYMHPEYESYLRQLSNQIDQLKLKSANDEQSLDAALAEVEHKEMQLSGVTSVALGETNNIALPSDYGWHPAYQHTLMLRVKYEQLQQRIKELEDGLRLYANRNNWQVGTVGREETTFEWRGSSGGPWRLAEIALSKNIK
jgi:hypothetical protein